MTSPSAEAFLVGFDIETDTSVGGLNPEDSAIIAVAVSTPDGAEVFQGDESEILGAVDDFLLSLPAGYLVTWNGSTFDLPFVEYRANLLGVPIALRIAEKPVQRPGADRVAVVGFWGELVHLDGLSIYRADVGRSLGLSCALKPLARLVGVEAVELNRETLHLADPREIEEYVASDAAVAVELVSRRMPHALRSADKWPVTEDPVEVAGPGPARVGS